MYKYKYEIMMDFDYVDSLFLEYWESIGDDVDDAFYQTMEEVISDEDFNHSYLDIKIRDDNYVVSFLSDKKMNEKKFEANFNEYAGKYDKSKIKIKVSKYEKDLLEEYRVNFDKDINPKDYDISYDSLMDKINNSDYCFIFSYETNINKIDINVYSLLDQAFEDVDHYDVILPEKLEKIDYNRKHSKTLTKEVLDKKERECIDNSVYNLILYLKYNKDKIDKKMIKKMINHDIEKKSKIFITDEMLKLINDMGLNRYLVESLIEIDGNYIKYANDKLKNDKKLVIEAFKNSDIKLTDYVGRRSYVINTNLGLFQILTTKKKLFIH